MELYDVAGQKVDPSTLVHAAVDSNMVKVLQYIDQKMDSKTALTPPAVARDGGTQLWVRKLEITFLNNTPPITKQETMYNRMVAGLDHKVICEVEELVAEMPVNNPYDKLKTAVLDAFGPVTAKKEEMLFAIDGFGERSASSFLRHVRSLIPGTSCSCGLLRAFVLNHMPKEVKRHMATSSFSVMKVDELCKEADSVMDRLGIRTTINAVSPIATTDRVISNEEENLKEFILEKHRMSVSAVVKKEWNMGAEPCKWYKSFKPGNNGNSKGNAHGGSAKGRGSSRN
ncbi:hypothetical protein TCAL_16738 [Tigriopus californicus]|uniref:DUF7041 domain-containing protein n=1 Tax=Tigriopus californicus TaxID=6832 RepID=A0A553PTR2_TIGCA|nr:hypothetical protein TCAL_16738 [Tigriopus californicus]